MKEELIEKLQTLLQNEQITEIIDGAHQIVHDYQQAKDEFVKSAKATFVEEGGDPHYFEPPKDPLDSKFKELQNLFITRYEEHKAAQKEVYRENLEIKQDLIEQLQDVVSNEENISKAFNRMNAIRKKWDETGPVPRHKQSETREQFSKLVEEFYYHIKIFKELKDHDFKKSLDHKNQVIENIEKLMKLDSIKEIQLLLDAYLVEWDQIGPTFQNDWPDVKDRFYKAYHEVTGKIREHFKQLRDKQKEHAEAKQKIIDETKALITEFPKDHRGWKSLTDKVNNMQEEYKKIGPAQRTKNNSLWDDFRAVIDAFYDAKREFYQQKKAEFKEVRSDKSEIIEKAKSLIPAEDVNFEKVDWKRLTNQIIKLQKDWRGAGLLAQSEERKLWKFFRSVCDDFFAKKKSYFDSLEDRQKENLAQKENIIEQLEQFEPSGENEKDMEQLRKLTFDYQQVGLVPFKDKNKLNNRFTAATADVAKKLNLTPKQLKQTLFKAKLEVIKTEDPTAKRTLQNEKRDIDRKVKSLQDEKLQYENNLGFFQYTPNDNPMKKEVLDKIGRIEKQINELKEKSKNVNLALRELNKQAEEAAKKAEERETAAEAEKNEG